jgi:AcrR family transcriptional regulator
MVGRTRRTQEERRDEAEQRMLAAGVHLLAVNGPEKLTLTDVGVSAGYSRGLPAHHFGSREDYLKALASYVAVEFNRTLGGAGQASGLAAVLEITRVVLEQIRTDPTRGLATQIVLADPRQDQALSDEVAALRDQTLSLLAGHVRDGIARGEIRADASPDHAGLLIAAGICGLIEVWLANPQYDIHSGGEELLKLIEMGLSRSV